MRKKPRCIGSCWKLLTAFSFKEFFARIYQTLGLGLESAAHPPTDLSHALTPKPHPGPRCSFNAQISHGVKYPQLLPPPHKIHNLQLHCRERGGWWVKPTTLVVSTPHTSSNLHLPTLPLLLLSTSALLKVPFLHSFILICPHTSHAHHLCFRYPPKRYFSRTWISKENTCVGDDKVWWANYNHRLNGAITPERAAEGFVERLGPFSIKSTFSAFAFLQFWSENVILHHHLSPFSAAGSHSTH